jgi:electron transfer flavoprotein alpha subunit
VAAIFVYAEVGADGSVDRSALGLLAKARSLADDVAAVALGAGAAAAAPTLGEHGARTVLAGDDPVYDECLAEPAAHVLAQLARERRPDLVLFGPGYDSRDVAGRLQALLGSALVANVDDVTALDRVRLKTPLKLWPGRPGNLRGGIGGAKNVDVSLGGARPALVLTRSEAFEPEPLGGESEVVRVEIEIPGACRRARRIERHEEQGGAKLEDAQVVVAGGRGLGEAESLSVLDELAAVFRDAAVGVTRPVVDAGWAPFSRQVGQTGKTVKPEVYIAAGISGAAQHVAGIKGAHRIVAINTDANAPIFQLADLGVVADALEVLRQLVAELASA